MTFVDATTAATLVTEVTGVITDNMAGILVLVGTFVGIKIARGFFNRSTSGKV